MAAVQGVAAAPLVAAHGLLRLTTQLLRGKTNVGKESGVLQEKWSPCEQCMLAYEVNHLCWLAPALFEVGYHAVDTMLHGAFCHWGWGHSAEPVEALL